ncbi:MAG: VanZ family protein [Luteolibacter sp.]
MRRVTRCPKFWLAALIIWFGVLWILSSSTHPDIPMPPIEDFDKVEHFGYFFGGAVLFSAYLFRKKPDFAQWRIIIPTVIIGMALLGWLDECHQGFVPGRSGNDPFDWMADVLGASAGAFFFKIIHRRLL